MIRFFQIALCLLTFPLAPMVSEGVQTVQEKSYPPVVLGGGVGGTTAALYLARAGVTPIVIEGKMPGGLLTQSHSVQNWPGEMEIDGTTLTEKFRAQAEASGAQFLAEEVIGVNFSAHPFLITIQNPHSGERKQLQASSCIIAMGTQPNLLGVPGEKEFWGKGVTNCAICDGNLYRDQVVGVVGGGDAAVLEALYLANIAKEVHVFVRKSSLRALEEKRVETLLATPNITMHYNSTVEKIQGTPDKLTSVMLKTGSDTSPFKLDGLFLAIGSKPNTSLFKNILKLDSQGYILLKKDQQTSLEGVYAVGDIVDPIYKQAVIAAGDGARAALQAHQFISDKGHAVAAKAVLPQKAAAQPREVIEISSLEQFKDELASGIPVVVDFYATWCGPCKRISPMIESSADKLSGKVKFLKVNVDALHEISATYEIRAMPTVLMFNASGDVVERKVGTDQITSLLKQLEKGLAAP